MSLSEQGSSSAIATAGGSGGDPSYGLTQDEDEWDLLFRIGLLFISLPVVIGMVALRVRRDTTTFVAASVIVTALLIDLWAVLELAGLEGTALPPVIGVFVAGSLIVGILRNWRRLLATMLRGRGGEAAEIDEFVNDGTDDL